MLSDCNCGVTWAKLLPGLLAAEVQQGVDICQSSRAATWNASVLYQSACAAVLAGLPISAAQVVGSLPPTWEP